MPSPEPPRRSDLSAVPSFLREGDRAARADSRRASVAAPERRALPRPTTPTEPQPEPEQRLDPASLPMPSLSRRRVFTVAGLLVAGLLTLSFVRQVGDASAAADRAAELRVANVALRDDVARLQRDLYHVQDESFIQLEARAYGLGAKGEIPFALAAGAPALDPDAPGSAAVRLGAPERPRSPLDAWLTLLFGDAR